MLPPDMPPNGGPPLGAPNGAPPPPNGGPPPGPPPPPSVEEVTGELLRAVKTLAVKAQNAGDAEQGAKYLQGTFFGAQAFAQLKPPMKPIDPNIHTPPHMDPTAVMKETVQASTDAQKQAHDSAMKLMEQRHQAELESAKQAHDLTKQQLDQQHQAAQAQVQAQQQQGAQKPQGGSQRPAKS